jgi:hypothetical protein
VRACLAAARRAKAGDRLSFCGGNPYDRMSMSNAQCSMSKALTLNI